MENNYIFESDKKYVQVYNLKSEPVENTYKQLIEFAFSVSDSFMLVERDDVIKNNSLKKFLDKISKYQIDVMHKSSFAGTQILGGSKAKVFCYKTNNDVKDILLSCSSGLYDWVQPNLPEDLSFMLNNLYVLINTAHEKSSGIYISNVVTMEKINSIVGLDGELVYATPCYVK